MYIKNLKRLKDKVVLITGGAQGLGEALAARMHDEGAKICIADLNLEQAEKATSSLDNAISVKCDVSDYQDCVNAVDKTIQAFGKIDILVSNAAILISNPIEQFDAAAWKKVVDINLCGCFNIMKAATPHLIKNGGGSMIQINSKSGKKGSSKNSAYAASKFGGIGLVQSLALELAEHNIRVNAICPGNLLDSPLWVNSLYEQYARNQNTTKEAIREKYINQVPLHRGCQYDDVANALVFLASDEAAYMTGQAINVTGGQEMK